MEGFRVETGQGNPDRLPFEGKEGNGAVLPGRKFCVCRTNVTGEVASLPLSRPLWISLGERGHMSSWWGQREEETESASGDGSVRDSRADHTVEARSPNSALLPHVQTMTVRTEETPPSQQGARSVKTGVRLACSLLHPSASKWPSHSRSSY